MDHANNSLLQKCCNRLLTNLHIKPKLNAVKVLDQRLAKAVEPSVTRVEQTLTGFETKVADVGAQRVAKASQEVEKVTGKADCRGVRRARHREASGSSGGQGDLDGCRAALPRPTARLRRDPRDWWAGRRCVLRRRVRAPPRLGVVVVRSSEHVVSQDTYCTGYAGRCGWVRGACVVAGEAARRGLPALVRGAKREPRNHVAAGFCRQKFRKTNPEPRQTRRPREEVKLGNYALDDEKAPQKRVLDLGHVDTSAR